MRSWLSSLLAGALFGLGLAISGMTQPAKVVGFLDFFGNWDPSLACVMGGALLAYFPLYRLITRRKTPLFTLRFVLPTTDDLDKRLLIGAAIFGVGWGLGGFCPGPGLTAAGSGASQALIFTGAMMAGFVLHKVFYKLFERLPLDVDQEQETAGT